MILNYKSQNLLPTDWAVAVYLSPFDYATITKVMMAVQDFQLLYFFKAD